MRIENEKMENERMENTKMEDERMEQYSIIGKEDLIGMLKTNYEQIGIILSTLEEYGYMNQDRWKNSKSSVLKRKSAVITAADFLILLNFILSSDEI